MSNLIPTVKRNGSDRNSKLGFRTLPSISSWMDDIINENFGNEFLSKLEEIKLTPDLKKIIIKSDKEPNQIILDPSTKLLAEWNFKKQIK